MKKKYELILSGSEYGASCHDLSKDEYNSLKSIDLNLNDISNSINEYDPWATNFWDVSKPLNDENLIISLKEVDLDDFLFKVKPSGFISPEPLFDPRRGLL